MSDVHDIHELKELLKQMVADSTEGQGRASIHDGDIDQYHEVKRQAYKQTSAIDNLTLQLLRNAETNVQKIHNDAQDYANTVRYNALKHMDMNNYLATLSAFGGISDEDTVKDLMSKNSLAHFNRATGNDETSDKTADKQTADNDDFQKYNEKQVLDNDDTAQELKTLMLKILQKLEV